MRLVVSNCHGNLLRQHKDNGDDGGSEDRSARMTASLPRANLQRYVLQGSVQGVEGACVVPVAGPLAEAVMSQQWLQLAKSTTSTLRRRGSSLQHRLGVIRTWALSHPMPPAAYVPAGSVAQATPISPLPGTGPTSEPAAVALSAAALQEQLELHTPLLSEDDTATSNPFITACLLHVASVCTPYGSNSAAGAPSCAPIDSSSLALLQQASLAWLGYNGVALSKARARCAFLHGPDSALLLYNYFPEALPSALWSMLWLCVSLLLQPIQPSTVAEKLGHALYSAKDLLNQADLAAARAAAVAGPSAASARRTTELEANTLKYLITAGCSSHSLSVPLTALPDQHRTVYAVPPGVADAGGITHPAQVTIWPLLTSAQLHVQDRKTMLEFLSLRYNSDMAHGSHPAYLPVCTRTVRDTHFPAAQHTDVHVCWLAPVPSTWLQDAQRYAPVPGAGTSSPLQSDYCPKVRISNLGSFLASRWTNGIGEWLHDS